MGKLYLGKWVDAIVQASAWLQGLTGYNKALDSLPVKWFIA